MMNKLKGRVLTHCGQFVDEDMLGHGIYSTDKPRVHWGEELTVEKYIDDMKFLDSILRDEPRQQYYENLKDCEFRTVTLEVNE